jgi:hypothetical protein
MSPRFALILWFAAGFVLEALYLVRRNPRWGFLGACVAAVFVGAFATYLKDRGSTPAEDTAVGLGLFAVVFASVYADQILPVVSEKLLFTFTVIFWYGYATEFYRGTNTQQLLAVASLVPTVATIYAAWTRPTLGFWGKLTLYCWYLLIVVFLGWLQFPFGNLSIFDERAPLGWLGPIEALATGMASLYLLANAWYLYLLVPIQGKGQSFSDRMKDWHELTGLMTQRCSEEDGPSDNQTAVVLAVIGSSLILNYLFKLLPNPMVISLAIIAAAVGLERLPVRKALGVERELPRPP